METVEQMADFVKLWDSVQAVQLTTEPDRIAWRWTADGSTQQNQLTMHNSWGPTVISVAILFGKQKQKASTNFLRGY